MSDFTIENLKKVLDIVAIGDEFPQEVITSDVKRTIAKVIGKIHPLALSSFMKGMEEMGIIRNTGLVTIIHMGSDDL